MRRRLILCVIVAMTAAATLSAAAQETREAAIRAAEAAHARAIAPPRPHPGERFIRRFDEPLSSGVLPTFGGVIEGGSVNLGAAYTRFFADTGAWVTRGVYSIRQFSLIESSVRLPEMAGGRLQLNARGAWNDGPRVEFFGVGPDSPDADRVFYGERRLEAGAAATVRPAKFVVLDGGLDYLRRRTGPNRGSGATITTRFDEATAPGLGADVDYQRYAARAGLDWRTHPGYADRGGLLQGTVQAFRDPDDRYSFTRAIVDAVQHVPILRANWIISLRGRLTVADPRDGQTIPHFMLTQLGGSTGVRGYGATRFRDRQALLLSAEYRWTPNETVDMAIFWDGGQVGHRLADLRVDRLRHSWGVGMRFHTVAATVLRTELAFAREGPRLVFAAGPSF